MVPSHNGVDSLFRRRNALFRPNRRGGACQPVAGNTSAIDSGDQFDPSCLTASCFYRRECETPVLSPTSVSAAVSGSEQTSRVSFRLARDGQFFTSTGWKLAGLG